MGHLLPHAGMGKQLAAAEAPPCFLGGHVLCGRGPPVLTVLRPVEGVLASMGSSRSQRAGRGSVCTLRAMGPVGGSVFREPSEPEAGPQASWAKG